ncbi:MAG: RluA family pseudouridine synthase [Bdellovibrionales bacterium]|nr:RluA family pseudouridine synthase [Bdellovibrionales bacterium]
MSNVHRELSPNQYLVRYAVGPNQEGTRLDNFLKEHYRKRSRESIKRAIDDGVVTLARNQGPHMSVGKLKASSQLVAGDEVRVLSEKKPEPPVNFDYKVIYEDDVLFVVDKPPNLPVHPSGRFFFNTLLIHLKTQAQQRALTKPLESDELYYLAHRIDKETSGILVLTKDPESCANVVAQFAARKTEKTYLAIVKGIAPETFACHEPMGRSKTSRVALKMECMPEDEGGQVASTTFRRLDVAGNYSLVEAFPKTGRQHQIRVHAERAGFPLLGDKLYGVDEDFALLFYERERLTPEAEARLIIPRHALHAHRLKITHPTTGKLMEFVSPLRADLRDFFESQR